MIKTKAKPEPETESPAAAMAQQTVARVRADGGREPVHPTMPPVPGAGAPVQARLAAGMQRAVGNARVVRMAQTLTEEEEEPVGLGVQRQVEEDKPV